MTSEIPTDLRRHATDWANLHRWERKQLGLALRRLGLTYSEIQSVIPVPSSTLSNWCQEVELTSEQKAAIAERADPRTRRGVPVDTQWRRRQELEEIRRAARGFAADRLHDPHFVAGVVMYWAEGSKTRNFLGIANTDPQALRTHISWVRRYLDPDATFVLSLHLHEGNDEDSAQTYWREVLELPDAVFTKTYIKPRGTGHRKNKHIHGVCRVRVRNASNHWNAVMEWIDVIGDHYGSILACSR